MLIGAMNHPQNDLLSEIAWMKKLNLDFIDISLEPPLAASWRIDPHEMRAALDDVGMTCVGHTAFYLPFASPFESIRKAAVAEAIDCLEAFAVLGAKYMNLHPDRFIPMHSRKFWVERNLVSLHELHDASKQLGVALMIENLPGCFNTVKELAELLDEVPDLGLHLDIGHSNLQVPYNTADELIARWPRRIYHVHLHDNTGGHADLHLPLGAGTIDIQRHLRALKKSGYDGTITLEVFTKDQYYLAHSREILRKLWDSVH